MNQLIPLHVVIMLIYLILKIQLIKTHIFVNLKMGLILCQDKQIKPVILQENNKEELTLSTTYKEQLQVLLQRRTFKHEVRFNLINDHDIISLFNGNTSNEIIKSLTINKLKKC